VFDSGARARSFCIAFDAWPVSDCFAGD
jgi:hypothetical protein